MEGSTITQLISWYPPAGFFAVSNQFVTIQSYLNPLEAHVAKTKLESEGVEVFLLNENTSQITAFYPSEVGGVQLQVRAADVERSKIYLGIHEKWGVGPQCPNCASRNLTMVSWLGVFRKRIKCLDCGHVRKPS